MSTVRAILQQLAHELDSPADAILVDDGNLMVAYDDGLRNYLMQCMAAVLVTKGLTATGKSEWVRTLIPEATRRLDAAQQLYPGDVSGADIGLALCALGHNPFIVSGVGNDINMDAIGWKWLALYTLSDLYTAATKAQRMEETRQAQQLRLPPPPIENNNTSRRAQLPEEFLVMLMHMLGDVGFDIDLITQVIKITGPAEPEWVPPGGFTFVERSKIVALPVPGVIGYTAAGSGETEVLAAAFSKRVAVRALIRAVIAVQYARKHAENAAALAALPEIKAWAIHTKEYKTGVSASTTYFSCLATRPSPDDVAFMESASDAQLFSLMKPLADTLDVWPYVVPLDMANFSGDQVVTRVGAFLGAHVPMIPLSRDMGRHPLMWYQRRKPSAKVTPNDWFINNLTLQTPPAGVTLGLYQFTGSRVVRRAMDVSAHIDARLAANPFCRACGSPLGGGEQPNEPKTRVALYCGNHRHLATHPNEE